VLLIIDNYDSFTYNLAQYFQELGKNTQVFFNNEVTIKDIETLNPSHLVISPGPGRPVDAGISLEVVRYFSGRLPILGVCLGHQAMAESFGADIVSADRIMHGKTSLIHHQQTDLFEKLPTPFRATRYHSLLVKPSTLSKDFVVTAWTQDVGDGVEEVMAIQHKTLPLYGVQFHPESIMTEYGLELLGNFLRMSPYTDN